MHGDKKSLQEREEKELEKSKYETSRERKVRSRDVGSTEDYGSLLVV